MSEAGTVAAVTPEADGRTKRRRGLRILFWLLIAGCIVAGALFAMYLVKPQALPDLIPLPGSVYVKPHYLYSIRNVDAPVGVALSPDGGRLYVAESDGQREIKILDPTGQKVSSFTIPGTAVGSRAPVYIAVGPTGRVFVTDRVQSAIYVFDANGKFIDEIIAPSMTMTGYLAQKLGALPPGLSFTYDLVTRHVLYQVPGEDAKSLPAPQPAWNPLGVRFDKAGDLLVTDVASGVQRVHVISQNALGAPSWQNFNPTDTAFGGEGSAAGQFTFPNVAISDSHGRVYVSDGNTGRISVWDGKGKFVSEFGGGGGGAVGLPRGMWIDAKDRLYVVDAVEQNVKVFDVSGTEPKFLAVFGGFGLEKGKFNFPNDIVVDQSGKLFIADRANNRIQVWAN